MIYLKGSIPGSKNTLVFLKNSVKNINKKTILEKNKIIEKKDTKPVISNAKENKIASKDIKQQATTKKTEDKK